MKFRIFIVCLVVIFTTVGVDAFEKNSPKYNFLSAYIQSPQMQHDFGDIFRLYSDNRELLHGKATKQNEMKFQSIKGELEELLAITGYLSNIHPDQIAMIKNPWDRLAFFINLFNALSIELIVNESWDSLHQSIKNKSLSKEQKFERFYNFDRYFSLDSFRFAHIGLLSLNDIMFGIILGNDDYLAEVERYAPDEAERLREINNAIIAGKPGNKVDFETVFLLNHFSDLGNSVQELPIRRAVTGQDLKNESFLRDIVRAFINDDAKGPRITYSINWWIIVSFSNIKIRLPYILSFFEQEIIDKYGSSIDFILEYMPKDHRQHSRFIKWLKENREKDEEITIVYINDKDLLDFK